MIITLDDNSTQYQQFKYPGGEWQVRFPDDFEFGKDVTVVARINSAEQIIKLALLINAIPVCTTLVLPYLPYSRADRRFTTNDTVGLGTFSSLIDAMDCKRVITVDAHNHEAFASCFQSATVDKSPQTFIGMAITDFASKRGTENMVVLFPDEGARTRYGGMVSTCYGDMVVEIKHCQKKRDPVTGKFLGFEVPDMDPNLPAIIVDDLCDGGGTFLGIAALMPDVRLGLYVTHGIFSQGLEKLSQAFAHIYTTNTFREEYDAPGNMTVFDAIPVLTCA